MWRFVAHIKVRFRGLPSQDGHERQEQPPPGGQRHPHHHGDWLFAKRETDML
jgi:hypothetical protein